MSEFEYEDRSARPLRPTGSPLKPVIAAVVISVTISSLIAFGLIRRERSKSADSGGGRDLSSQVQALEAAYHRLSSRVDYKADR